MLDIKVKTQNGERLMGFSQLLVDYITKTKRWNYVFDCLLNGQKINRTGWDY